MVKIIGKRLIHAEYCYVYEIELPNKNLVYMDAISKNYGNDETYAIIVISDVFLKFWKNVPKNNQIEYALSHGDKNSWTPDYKYNQAKEGFKRGKDNPVPIPKIKYIDDITPNYITVSDCTRTIWLLANGALLFPVECTGYNNAKNVYEFIGKKEFKLKL
jgi:hypothetical protein